MCIAEVTDQIVCCGFIEDSVIALSIIAKKKCGYLYILQGLFARMIYMTFSGKLGLMKMSNRCVSFWTRSKEIRSTKMTLPGFFITELGRLVSK